MQSLSARPSARVAAGARRPLASGRRLTVQVSAANVLIANTKGGGHAFIGLYLAKELLRDGHKVTIMNDGDKVRLRKELAQELAWSTCLQSVYSS